MVAQRSQNKANFNLFVCLSKVSTIILPGGRNKLANDHIWPKIVLLNQKDPNGEFYWNKFSIHGHFVVKNGLGILVLWVQVGKTDSVAQFQLDINYEGPLASGPGFLRSFFIPLVKKNV